MQRETVYRMGELFCGPGGLALEAIKARSADGMHRVEHLWANDYDADTCETYRNNICPDNPDSVKHGDVRKFDIETADRE